MYPKGLHVPMSHILDNYTGTRSLRDSSGYILPKYLQDYLGFRSLRKKRSTRGI